MQFGRRKNCQKEAIPHIWPPILAWPTYTNKQRWKENYKKKGRGKELGNKKVLTPQIQIIQFVVLVFDKIFPVFVSESLDKLFGCLGTDLSFMVHKRSLSLSLLCTISYHCRQSKRIVLFSFSKMRKFSFTTFLKPDFLVKFVYMFFSSGELCLQCFNSSWSAEELSARNVCFSFKSFS